MHRVAGDPAVIRGCRPAQRHHIPAHRRGHVRRRRRRRRVRCRHRGGGLGGRLGEVPSRVRGHHPVVPGPGRHTRVREARPRDRADLRRRRRGEPVGVRAVHRVAGDPAVIRGCRPAQRHHIPVDRGGHVRRRRRRRRVRCRHRGGGLGGRLGEVPSRVRGHHPVVPGPGRHTGVREARLGDLAEPRRGRRGEPVGVRAVHDVARDGDIVGRGRPRQHHVLVDRTCGEVGRRRRRRPVGRRAPGAQRVVVSHLLGRQRVPVDRHLVDAAGEVDPRGLVGPAVEVVPADPPVACVALVGRLAVGADQDAVHVQGQAVRALGADNVVGLPVVVLPRRGDGGGVTGVHAEDEATVVGHVDLLVVVVAEALSGVAEPDELAAGRGRRGEPGLGAEPRRGPGARGGPDTALVAAVERHGRSGGDGGRLPERHAAEDLSGHSVQARVSGNVPAGLVQAPVQVGVVVVHGRAVTVRRRRRHVRRSAGERVVLDHLLLGEDAGVDRRLVDEAVEEVRGGLVGPAVEVVPTGAPRSAVGLGVRHRVAADPLPVHVQRHAGRALGGDHVVPLAVVVGLARGERLRATGPDAEGEAAVVVHVDVPVVAAAQRVLRGVVGGRDRVAVAQDLPARGGRGVEPGLRGVRGRALGQVVAVRVGRTAEVHGVARLAGHRVGGGPVARALHVLRVAVAGRGVGAVAPSSLVIAPVERRTVTQDGGGIGHVRAGRPDGDRRGLGRRGRPVADADPVAVLRARHRCGVGEGRLRQVPPPRLGPHLADLRAVTEDAVGEVAVVGVENGAPAHLHGPGGERLRGRRRGRQGAGVWPRREAGQALLRGTVRAGELPTDPQDLLTTGAGNRQRTRADALAVAVVELRAPGEHLGVVRALRRQVDPAAVGEPPHGGAVVVVVRRVQRSLVDHQRLGRTQAVVAPALVEVGVVDGQRAVEHASAGSLVADVEARRVGGDRLGRRGVRDEAARVVAHVLPRHRVDRGDGVRVLSVDGEEVAPDQDHGPVGGDGDGLAERVRVRGPWQ